MKMLDKSSPLMFVSWRWAVCILFAFGYIRDKADAEATDMNKEHTGQIIYHNWAIEASCGAKQQGITQSYATVATSLFKDPASKTDPMCRKCVEVKANGKTAKFRIKGESKQAPVPFLELSHAGWEKVADPKKDNGVIASGTWKVIECTKDIPNPGPYVVKKVKPYPGLKIKGGWYTYYDVIGSLACGESPGAKARLVAVGENYWLNDANHNKDDVCKLCVNLHSPDKKKKALKVPVMDWCGACMKKGIDLSPAVFEELGLDKNVGKIKGMTWEFTSCKGGGAAKEEGGKAEEKEGKHEKEPKEEEEGKHKGQRR